MERFTCLRTGEGWLYLTVVLSLYTRAVIEWTMKSRLISDLVLDTVTMALSRRDSRQYASEDFITLFETTGIEYRISRTGNCYDNAVAESFFATFEAGAGY